MDLSYTFTNSGDCKIIYLKETEIRKRNKTFVMGLMYLEGKALLIACHLIIIEIQHKEMMMMMIIIHFSFMMWMKGGGVGLMTHVADLSIIIRGCNRIDSRVSSANSF